MRSVGKRVDTEVDSESSPIFGLEDTELHLLRQLHMECRVYFLRDEDKDGYSIIDILNQLQRLRRKKKN